MTTQPMITVTSFGYGHDSPPDNAHLILDVRTLFRDPAVDQVIEGGSDLIHQTGRDPEVIERVLSQPGARLFASNLALTVFELWADTRADVTVAVGCRGGRHRSVVLANAIGGIVAGYGGYVSVDHRDIDKPVLARTSRHDAQNGLTR